MRGKQSMKQHFCFKGVTMSANVIDHVEIPVIDLDKGKDFYSNVFGWDFKPFGRGYYLHNTKTGLSIGLRKAEKVQSGDTTIFHLRVSDVDTYLDMVKNHGGKVYREKTVIPVYGFYALFTDPDGNILGLFQSH